MNPLWLIPAVLIGGLVGFFAAALAACGRGN